MGDWWDRDWVVPEGMTGMTLYHLKYSYGPGSGFSIEAITVVEKPTQYRRYWLTSYGKEVRYEVIDKGSRGYDTDPVRLAEVNVADCQNSVVAIEGNLATAKERLAKAKALLVEQGVA